MPDLHLSLVLHFPVVEEPMAAVLQFSMWAAIGISVFAIFLAALMAGYYVFARSVFKRNEVLAYFD